MLTALTLVLSLAQPAMERYLATPAPEPTICDRTVPIVARSTSSPCPAGQALELISIDTGEECFDEESGECEYTCEEW